LSHPDLHAYPTRRSSDLPDHRLRYQPLAAPDAHTRTYILYSVGADGTDDGGRLHADPEAAFTDAALKPLQPRDEFAGYDAVANRSEEHTSELQSRENLVC